MCDVMRHYEDIAREQGIQQEKKGIALKLLQNGMEPDFIAETTGLTPEQVAQLQGSNGNV